MMSVCQEFVYKEGVMKYLLLFVLAGACFFIGFIFSKKYKKRANFFQALVMLCQKFDVEINFSRERLKNIFQNLDQKQKDKLAGLVDNFLSYIEQEIPLEKETLFKGITFLKEEEKDVVFMFFKSLGRSDVDSQSKEAKNYLSRFETLSSSANNENKKYGSLSVKLGIIAGLFVIVLFI